MLENYEKEKEKIENPEPAKPAWEPTLKSTLSEVEGSDLFGELLNSGGQGDLAERLAKGELAQDDIEALDTARKDFRLRMERADTVKESITEDVINAYAKNNPELQKVVSLIGPERYKEIVKEKMKALAIKDPSVFESLADAVENKNRFKSDYFNPLDKEIVELCNKKKINPEEYTKALAIEDHAEREKALRKAVRGGYNWFQKAGDWLSQGEWSHNRVELMNSKRDDIEAMIEQMRYHQSNVGGFLAGVTQNEEVRNAVAKELIGEKEGKVPLQGFQEAKGTLPKEKAFQTEWEQHKKAKGWETKSANQRDAIRSEFINKQRGTFVEKNKNKSGFWGSIFSALFDSFINNSRANLN